MRQIRTDDVQVKQGIFLKENCVHKKIGRQTNPNQYKSNSE